MRVGLIGWPVAHSLSPRMHQAAFAACGIDGRYELLPVEPGAVEAALRDLPAQGFRGVNVTVPHKQAALAALDHVTSAATRLGAVNTIWVEDEALHGDNTDLPGFLAHLGAEGVDPRGMRALVLGAGGSARAIVAGLLEAGCVGLTVLNRTPAHAEALLAELGDARCGLGAFPADVAAHADAELIVNCTSLGLGDGALAWDPAVTFRPGQVVYDLVYAPRETPLLAKAGADGARPIGGLGMLVHQGALAFERWTGQPAPLEVMMTALEDAC